MPGAPAADTEELALLLRALRAAQLARSQGRLAMPEEEARRLAFLADLALRFVQARIRPDGDALVVELILTPGAPVDNVVVEDLLPAGLELENPAIGFDDPPAWMCDPGENAWERGRWLRHREFRDDRLLLFTGPLESPRRFFYRARAVTAGTYTWPAVSAEAMYQPAIHAHAGRRTLTVR